MICSVDHQGPKFLLITQVIMTSKIFRLELGLGQICCEIESMCIFSLFMEKKERAF